MQKLKKTLKSHITYQTLINLIFISLERVLDGGGFLERAKSLGKRAKSSI
jgi:hypothetical protein